MLTLFPSTALHTALRFPQEKRTLWYTFGMMGLLILLASWISFGGALLLVVFALFTVNTLGRINHRKHIGNALRIGQRQFPNLAVQAAKAAKAVQAPPVQIFIYQDDKINAYSFGWSYPQAVVMSSELVEAMDEDEFRFVVGHEMGHVTLGHTRLGTLVGGLLGAPNVPILSQLLVPIFLWWSRCAEYSADRAGLIACGNLEKAISSLIKLLVGRHLSAHVNLDEVIAQSQELSRKLDALAGEFSSTHPYLVHRVRELVQFWETPECQRIIAQGGNHAG